MVVPKLSAAAVDALARIQTHGEMIVSEATSRASNELNALLESGLIQVKSGPHPSQVTIKTKKAT